MPHIPIPYPWAYDFFNTVNFKTFDEVSAHEQVCSMNQWRIYNSNTAVLKVPTKSDIKQVFILSMTCDIEILP